MSELFEKRSIDDIIHILASTTENTYERFLELTEDRDKFIRDRIIERLSIPFDQFEEKYIKPQVDLRDSFNFIYTTHDYDLAYSRTSKDDLLAHAEAESEAFNMWLKRKQNEVQQIVDTFNKGFDIGNSESSFPTFRHSSKVSIDQIKQIYEILISDPVFIEDSNRQLFLDCFTKSTLSVQPKIKFFHKPQILYHLFRLLDTYHVIINQTKSDIFSKNQLFVSDNGSPFKTSLRQGLDYIKDYPRDTKQKQLVLHLESSFKSIFDRV